MSLDNLNLNDEINQNKKHTYNSFRGSKINESKNHKYVTKKITVENLIECYNKGLLIIPDFQRQVNNSKIDQMKNSYLEDPESFNYLTNSLQIGQINNLDICETEQYRYLIDGQHRFFMYEQLYNEYSSNSEIIVNFITFTSAEEMKKQYLKFNADNSNIFFDISEIEKYEKYNRYLEFKKSLSGLYKKYFKQNEDKIYNIDEFIKKIETHDYLDYFEKITDALEYLIEKINLFMINIIKINLLNYLEIKKFRDLFKKKKSFHLKVITLSSG